MSENLHNIDDLFKKAIDEHEDAPSQKVWDAIDKNLDKKKVVSISRKYNKLKWAAAILLLFSTGMAMYVWQTRMKNKELVKQNNINKSLKENKAPINNDEKNSTPEIKPTESENKSNPGNKSDATSANTQTAVKEKKDQPSISPAEKVTVEKGKTQAQIAVQDQDGSREATNPDKTNKEINSKERQQLSQQDNLALADQKYFSAIPMIADNGYQLDSRLKIYPRTDLFSSSLKYLSAPPENITDHKTSPSARKNSKPAKAGGFSATVFLSPEFSSSDLKDDHPRFREDDRHEIKNNEHVRASTSFGVLINYNTGKKLTLQSGVSLFTNVTDINTKTIYARPDNNGNVNFRLSCSAGSAYVSLKSGAAPAQGDSTRILSAKNTLQYVSIPLGVKYNIGKGKFNLVPGIGISANILSKGKVETVIAAAGGNENSSSKIEGLKSNYFDAQVSAGTQYNISNRIAVNFTPTVRLALTSINNNAAVKTKLNTFGLSAGVTIKL